MIYEKRIWLMSVLFAAFAACAMTSDTGVVMSTRGSTFYEFLYIMKSNEPLTDISIDTALDGTWNQQAGGTLGLLTKAGARTEIYFGLNSYLWFTMQGAPQINSGRTARVTASIDLGYAKHTFGRLDNPLIEATLGYFNMTYAPEAVNLGEYLFRSGVYPGFLLSGPGGYDMLGLRLHSAVIKNLHLDFLFTTEINIFPNFDYSPSLLAHYTLADILTVGAGAMFNRLISVRRQNTTPDLFAYNGHLYTHAGTKLMARLSLDPKPLFSSQIFGSQDMLVYTEAVMLGVENYPVFYENPRERVALMGGIHFPAFKILDYTAFEMEWYGSPWKNNPYNRGVPYPSQQGSRPGSVDDVKWSFTLAKTIPGWMTVTARAARDHWRQENGNGFYQSTELMTRPGHWYMAINFTARFETDQLNLPFGKDDTGE